MTSETSVIQKMRIESRELLEKKTFQYWLIHRHWQGNIPEELGKPMTVAKAITGCNTVLKGLNPSTKLSIRTCNLLEAIINKPEKAETETEVKASG